MMLTLLSLSLGGSWGSVAEDLGGGGGDGALGFSLGGGVSILGFCSSTFSSLLDGTEVTLLEVSSDGATCVTPSPDFEMMAILVPGSTVSPSLATNLEILYRPKCQIQDQIDHLINKWGWNCNELKISSYSNVTVILPSG